MASVLPACGASSSSSSAATAAPLASDIGLVHSDGQTFITWRESSEPGVRYRVYRATGPIRSEAELAGADLLGEVDDLTSFDQERTRAENVERTWLIPSAPAPLASDQGLFVYTVERDTLAAFYAVTSVRAGREERALVPGSNATRIAVVERTAPPEAVLQAFDGARETWAHWVSNRDTPFQAALSPWPSRGFDFAFEPGTAPGPRGLFLRLHEGGGNHARGWPRRGLVPADVDVLAPTDRLANGANTFFFGTHERFPAQPEPGTRVWSFTQERVLWTLDWMTRRLGSTLDPERIYVAGSSLGAVGAMYLVEERPELFAAALLRNGNYDFRASDMTRLQDFEYLFGPRDLDLPMRSGLGVLERTSARTMATLAPAAEWPVLRTLNGRADTRAGWASAVGLFGVLAETHRPGVHYFDEREHVPDGFWSPLERALVRRTCAVRRDRPSLRFDGCTLDEDAGDGGRASGDPIGTLAGRVDYDPATAASTFDLVRFDVFVRAEGSLDDAPVPAALASLTPRRTGPFVPAPGEHVRFTLREGATLIAEHLLMADELGLVHTPPVPLSTARREARFELLR